ncbi:xanthine dehydrogenase molybdopterin-binding subunit B [Rhizobium aquaticum]|uniref:Xanthine dehydrogenase molybdopterin-binding subunit B n=1 Tax=Rhizobium aquaticum TaxID=1549636 RepID=A0ABV2J023_9HYPH
MTTYPLRLADHVMEEARRAAMEDNVSLNQLLSAFIADGIGHRRAIMSLKTRAERGDVDAALAILAKAPDVPPEAGDEIVPRKRSG